MNEDLRFPIGKFENGFEIKPEVRKGYIRTISDLPDWIRDAVSGLSEEQIDTEYRPDGWTIRQVVHHVADSHMNSYCRFKLGLTEEVPTIRAYYEDRWAELPDSKLPIEQSLKIIDGVHARWTNLLESMTDEDFGRRVIHPESGEWRLDKLLGLYDWHSKHHTAHITKLRQRMAW